MNILSIDVGTYSIKFVRGVLERRQVRFLDCQEKFIHDASKDFHPTMPLRERQIEIIKSFWDESDDSKIIFQVPDWLLTSRYLILPTSKQKQISMMIPFQLEEKLPYAMAKAHHISWVEKEKNKSHVAVSVVQKSDFHDYYELLAQTEILPSTLTSELFVINSYLKNNTLSGAAVILDMGHETTKAYFIYNGMAVSNQTSFTGGKIIDEAISKTYNVSLEEASEYKHKNCFFVTADQYDEISSEQKEFAELMEKIFTPFIQEYKRWELGYRINYGEKVDTVYIMGGTSKIHNITDFLKESLEVNVQHLPEWGYLKKDEGNFSLAKLMVFSQKGKHVLPSFLYGEYSGKVSDDVFLHSTGFILSRTMIFSIIAVIFLLIERFAFINPAISKQDRVNNKILKDPEIALTSRERRDSRRRPERVLKKINSKFQNVEQEVSAILSATSINALSPLSLLSSFVGKTDGVDLVEFESDGKNGMAVFKSEKIDNLQKLEQQLRNFVLPGKKIIRKKNEKVLMLTFGKKR